MSLKPIRNVRKQLYAAENPRILFRNFKTNGQPYPVVFVVRLMVGYCHLVVSNKVVSNCAIAFGRRAYILQGFLQMLRGGNAVRNSRNFLCFWPTTQRVYVCWNFA